MYHEDRRIQHHRIRFVRVLIVLSAVRVLFRRHRHRILLSSPSREGADEDPPAPALDVPFLEVNVFTFA